MTPMCLGNVLFMLLDNYTDGGVILEGTSQWKDKLGQQVTDPRLTVRIAPLHDAVVCGERYTQEGFLSEDYDVIKDGVLKQFGLSAYIANKVGGKRAPNTAANMVVSPGDTTLEDMIAGTKKGLLVSRFSGGQPGTNGDFSGVAKNTFLIEDGKIAGAVNETMISGNLADVFNNIAGISQQRNSDGMFLLPWMAFNGITISGNNRKTQTPDNLKPLGCRTIPGGLVATAIIANYLLFNRKHFSCILPCNAPKHHNIRDRIAAQPVGSMNTTGHLTTGEQAGNDGIFRAKHLSVRVNFQTTHGMMHGRDCVSHHRRCFLDFQIPQRPPIFGSFFLST